MTAEWLTRNIYQRARLFSGLAAYRLSGTPQPLMANLFLTGKCNAKCVYCYVPDVNPPDDQGDAKRRLTGEEWIGLIDALIVRGVRGFTLVGGEPMVSPYCDDIIDHLHARNMFFNMTTNGSLVIKKLDKVRKVSQLTISLDGDEESNDLLRGKGWHRRTMNAIEAAADAGIPVRLNVVVTKANRHEVGYIIALCDRLNMFVTFTPCIDAPDFRMGETSRWMLDDDEVRAYFTELLAWKKRTHRIMNSERSMRYMIDYPTSFDRVVMATDPEASYYPEKCPYGRIQYHFNEFGEVYPCGIWWNRDDFTPKTVFDGGLDAAIANATDMPCQYCSFCNLVDWNELTKPKSAVSGFRMTVRQYLSGKGPGAKSAAGAADPAA